MQYIQLSVPVLAGNLEPVPIDDAENNAIGQLLHFRLGCIWRLEVAHVVPLDGACLMVSVLALNRDWHTRCPSLDGAQNQEPLAVQADGPALPEEIVGELHVDVAHV